MAEITDDFMRQMLSRSRDNCLVILKARPNRNRAGADKILWEHGRRNFALRAEGLLAIICPVVDGSDVSGIGIFDANSLGGEKDNGWGSRSKGRNLRLRDPRLPE